MPNWACEHVQIVLNAAHSSPAYRAVILRQGVDFASPVQMTQPSRRLQPTTPIKYCLYCQECGLQFGVNDRWEVEDQICCTCEQLERDCPCGL